MNSTGEPMDALRARDALAAACAARTAARKAGERERPLVYTIAQGLTSTAGFTLLGLADLEPQWGQWWVLTGGVSLIAFLVLNWLGAHHGGVTRWFGRDRGTGRSTWTTWVAPLVPVAVSLLGGALYGSAGFLIVFGLASGVEHLLRALRRPQGGTA